MPHKFTNLSLEGEPLDQLQQVDQSQSDISAEIVRHNNLSVSDVL